MLHERDGDVPRPELIPGARVKVIKDPEWNGPWPDEPLGTIQPVSSEPTPYKVSDSQWGKVREYFVRFDTPQLDSDGQGPYVSAMIWQQYLRAVDSDPQP